MPIGNKIQELFKRYIILKGLACLGYGLCVGALLRALSADLAEVFGLCAFLLSFVPEVGAIVAILLPMPVILFDSRLESPAFTLLVATMAQLGLKFVFANVVEVKLVEADQLMKMHPVIILLAVTFFGFIWGPTGMLLSVPLVAYVKVMLLSDQVPACYRDPLLVIMEGDRAAPAKYARKRLKEKRTGKHKLSGQSPFSPDSSQPRSNASPVDVKLHGDFSRETRAGGLADDLAAGPAAAYEARLEAGSSVARDGGEEDIDSAALAPIELDDLPSGGTSVVHAAASPERQSQFAISPEQRAHQREE